MPRRSYDHYCAIARALDVVGERWTLLIVRELLGGPRRYSGLLGDLPGISTDVLAARLREMEADGLLARRPAAARGAAFVYALTADGRALSPVVEALAAWGGPRLTDRSPTDAQRPHWLALPLARHLRESADHRRPTTVEVRLEDGTFHIHLGHPDAAEQAGEPGSTATRAAYGDGPAGCPDAVLAIDHATATAIAADRLALDEALRTGRATISGATPIAAALTGDPPAADLGDAHSA